MGEGLSQAVSLFYSYAPSSKDEAMRQELEKHLMSLQRRGLIASWSRRDIVAGEHVQEEVNAHLEHATIILLLISPDFLASDYYYGAEMLRALERSHAGEACVIPILLRPVYMEDEPFTRLASLPTNGKPISMWRNRDAAFAEIAREISRSIRALQRASVTTNIVDPFHLAHDPLNYFTRLETFLNGDGSWLQEDYKRGKIYLPEREYFASIERVLNTKHRVLLLGRAASGKTVLAITFANHLQEHAGYRIGYKDVRQAEVGDGRKWYALAREHDVPGTLYILDNCHLAPREVSEFCRQWKALPPTHTQCLLISRVNSHETHTEDTAYLHIFSDDEKIVVRSENIYLGIIERYASALRNEYVDTLKRDDVAMLQKQHAHNLVISRNRLDVWEALGPSTQLSEIQQEDLYRVLETKYFARYGTSLATLCILQRYEIRAHTFFVRTLLQDEVKQLEREKLLLSSTVAGYGQLYDLVLHPTEARELFLAYVFNQYGKVNQENIQRLVVEVLEAYLMVKPANYITVYDSLARQRHEDILKGLLLNRNLQDVTMGQFGKETLIDAIRYVYRVARHDSEAATRLMKSVVRLVGIQDICAKLLTYSYQDVTGILHAIQNIDAPLAFEIADRLATKRLALRISEENVQALFRLARIVHAISPEQAAIFLSDIPINELAARTTIRNFPDMVKQLQMYAYPFEQLADYVQLLDMQRFAQQSDTISLQSLFWTLYTLEKLSPQQTQLLLSVIPTWKLAMKSSVSNIGSIDQIMRLMQRAGYTQAQMVEFVDMLDMDGIGVQVLQGNLRRFASFLRVLKAISVSSATRLLETVTPLGVAEMFHVHESSLADLDQLRKVSTRAFWEAFLQKCSAQDIAKLFQRTHLGSVGTFLYYQYGHHTVQVGYALFQEQFLLQRLVTEPLNRIGEFLDRLSAIPRQGQKLAHAALGLLVTTDIAERVGTTNLLHFALLLHHARSIDAAFLPPLLVSLHQYPTLQSALERSNLYGIQLLIFNVANIDTAYVALLHMGLRDARIIEKFEGTPVKDIGLFLWNTYRYIDKDMAKQYCLYIDRQMHAQQLEQASPGDLCFFLWNLVSICSTQEIRILHRPYIAGLVRKGWRDAVGWSFVLIGIAAFCSEVVQTYQQLHPLNEEALVQWFATNDGGGNPYFFALALKGLHRYNIDIAETIVRKNLSLVESIQLLQRAKSTAITVYSTQLLAEMTQWLERLLEANEG